MFHRSLPPWFWLLAGCILLPSINFLNAHVILFFFVDKSFKADAFWRGFSDLIYLNLSIGFPLGLMSMMASRQWELGSYTTARFFCISTGTIGVSLAFFFFYVLPVMSSNSNTVPVPETTRIVRFLLLMQFLLPIIWSIGLLLTGFLLRTPRRA